VLSSAACITLIEPVGQSTEDPKWVMDEFRSHEREYPSANFFFGEHVRTARWIGRGAMPLPPPFNEHISLVRRPRGVSEQGTSRLPCKLRTPTTIETELLREYSNYITITTIGTVFVRFGWRHAFPQFVQPRSEHFLYCTSTPTAEPSGGHGKTASHCSACAINVVPKPAVSTPDIHNITPPWFRPLDVPSDHRSKSQIDA
jgi:hypothetical protein